MKKLILAMMAFLALSLAAHSQVRVGPFLGYGDGPGLWGIGAYTEIGVNDRVSISPIFTQYFPKDLDGVPRRNMWELNANANYYVFNGDIGYLYGLAGVNYTNIKIRTRTAFVDDVERDGNLGFNIGLGTMFRITDLLLPFAETKYTIGGYSQWTLIFGVKFALGDNEPEYDY